MKKRYYKNTMSNILQLLVPKRHNIIFKYEKNFEKHFERNMQNLTLYNTNFQFLYILAKHSLTHVFFISLNHLDPIVEK